MNIRKRLEKLERSTGAVGPSCVCGGTFKFLVVREADLSENTPPTVCPRCGKPALWVEIVPCAQTEEPK